jgi:hypothetical protein
MARGNLCMIRIKPCTANQIDELSHAIEYAGRVWPDNMTCKF